MPVVVVRAWCDKTIFSQDCVWMQFSCLQESLQHRQKTASSEKNYHIFVEWRTNGERSNLLHSTHMCLKISSMHLCSVVCESPAAMMRSLRVWLSVSVYRTLYDPFCPFIIYPWLWVFAFTRGCWYLPSCLINLLWCSWNNATFSCFLMPTAPVRQRTQGKYDQRDLHDFPITPTIAHNLPQSSRGSIGKWSPPEGGDRN